jgi:hypothetical protein
LDELYENIPQYDTKIVLGDFNAVVGKEVFHRPPIGMHSTVGRRVIINPKSVSSKSCFWVFHSIVNIPNKKTKI